MTRTTPVAERLRQLSSADPDTRCWLWTAETNTKGYGRIQVAGKTVFAHRASYEAFVGTIPEGLQIDHLCRNRACVNPAHLEPVTPGENTRRGLKGWSIREGLCVAGLHDVTQPAAVRVKADGGRQCLACRRQRDTERYDHDPERPNPRDVNRVKTHCLHGHEFTPENTRIRKNGQRQCKTCQRAYDEGRRR